MEQYRYRRCFHKALIFAFSGILLLYRNSDSVAYPLFMAITLWLIAWDSKSIGRNLIKNPEGKISIKLFYCVALVLLSITKCLTSSADLQWGSGMGIVLLFICLLLKNYSFQEGDEITAMFGKMMKIFIVPLKYTGHPFSDRAFVKKANAGEVTPGQKRARSIFIGILIAIPMLAVILALLSSADLIFGDLVRDILSSIRIPRIGKDYIVIPFLFLVSFISFYCWLGFLPVEDFAEGKEGRRFDAVVAITFNSLIAFVYVFFSAIQFIYLVGKMELPKNYTYAQYAHEGFYQLLAVTILNLILVSFCKKHFSDSKVLKVLLVIISLCTYVMIASSALRMFLYVGVYGLSHLRVYVFWLLVVLAVWTTILIIGIFREGIRYFRIITVFVTVWYLLFAFSLPDRWIAAYDLSLPDPPSDLVYEVYPDAAQIIREDGRYWEKYCWIMREEVDEYYDRNIIQYIREYNFCEDAAMTLIHDSLHEK